MSEEITGRLLKDMARRDEIVIATKAFFRWRQAPNTGGLSAKALMHALAARPEARAIRAKLDADPGRAARHQQAVEAAILATGLQPLATQQIRELLGLRHLRLGPPPARQCHAGHGEGRHRRP